MRRTCLAVVIVVIIIFVGSVHGAWAQNVGITGRATDETGAALPGTLVEAASPALIEGVRSTVTDGEGLFTITALRPGEYTVTFTLPGFRTVVRDGVVLSGVVLVTVNAELPVGGVEETLTVTGRAPDVDIRNVVQETTLDEEVRNNLPTGRNVLQMAELIPGMTVGDGGGATAHDVGGNRLNRGNTQIHGSRAVDSLQQFDGHNQTYGPTGVQGIRNVDPGEIAEFQYETSAISAETQSGGVRVNMIPKEGGDTFSGSFFTTFANDSMSSDNTSQELIEAGLPAAAELKELRDLNLSGGGPIRTGKLWWFASTRFEGAEKEAPGSFHAIDPLGFVWNPRLGAAGNVDESRPTIDDLGHEYYSGRLTWQATERNKLSFYLSDHRWVQDGFPALANFAYEAIWRTHFPAQVLAQGKWTAPLTNRLLLQATYGWDRAEGRLHATREGLTHNDRILGAIDVVNGTLFRANPFIGYGSAVGSHHQGGFSLSYVTGSHTARFGVDLNWGWGGFDDRSFNGQVVMFLANGFPVGAQLENGPWNERENYRQVGLYAQDQWTIDRLTVNAGVRYDAHVGSIPAEHNTSGPNRFAPFQQWPQIDDVPNWKDISPRLGVAYDLFGDARTALKFSASRYVVNEVSAFAQSVNPLLFNQTTVVGWRDLNGDRYPDDGELLGFPGSNANFATAATNVSADDEVREGWFTRQYNWEFAGGVQHQLLDGLSVEVMYVQRQYRNFVVDDLVRVGPSNYSEYCVTAPTDTRLGGVSGSEVCGLFDLDPAQFGLTETLRTRDTAFGTQKESWQGLDATLSLRTGNLTVTGGLSSGTQGNARDTCFVVDSPQAMYQCDVSPPWQNTVKLLGSFGLPYGIDASVVYQGIPGPEILANWTVTDAAVAAGTVRFRDPARVGFSGPTVEIPLVQPGTMYGDRLHQVDVRLSWSPYRSVGGMGVRVMLDVANLLNENTILDVTDAYGPNWLRPNQILFGRIFKPAVLFEW